MEAPAVKLGVKFAQTMNAAGVKVHNAVLLGRWLHINTNKGEEVRIYSALTKMGAVEIKTLQPGAEGRHLCGSRHHRIVATF